MLWNPVQLALREIRRNLTRSSLTMLGVVIGVSAVITMVTLGNGATRAVSNQIAGLGSNLLMLRPIRRSAPGLDASQPRSFRVDDAEAIEAQIASAAAVAPVVSASETVVYGASHWATSVTGSTSSWFTAGNWTIAAGRAFTETEERSGRAVCVLGETVRRELFHTENPVGARVRVGTFACEVVGLLASKGQASMGSDRDDTVVLPLRTVQRRIRGNQDVGSILITVREGESTEQATRDVETLLRERRRIAAGEKDDFSVMDTKEIAQAVSGTTRVLTMLLGAVAAVSLLVGGIGIMNIMLVSVTERTREIGIRLAIGALERQVLQQFLIEAVSLSLLGGIIGIALAAIASIVLTRVMNVPFVFGLGINLLAFAFSAAIGVIFGYFPARRAAHLDPIEALRYE